MRLHLMMNGPKGGDATRDKLMRELLVPNGRGGFEVVSRREKVLSRAYADVKLSGELIQVRRWGEHADFAVSGRRPEERDPGHDRVQRTHAASSGVPVQVQPRRRREWLVLKVSSPVERRQSGH